MFDVINTLGLLHDIKVINQRLQTPFIHEIPEIHQGRDRYKKEQSSRENDPDFDPLGPRNERERQKENIPGKRDEKNNQQDILNRKGKARRIGPNGQHHDAHYDEGEGPPEELDGQFLF